MEAGFPRQALALAYGMPAPALEVRRMAGGLIHHTFFARYPGNPGAKARLVHQRLNTDLFTAPEQVMENIARVTQHLSARLNHLEPSQRRRRVLSLVPTAEGRTHWVDRNGDWWRTFEFIDGAHSLEETTRPDTLRSAAAAFGRFSALLSDLPPPPLHETLPGFHRTTARLGRLESALAEAPRPRTRDTADVASALLDREGTAGRIDALIDGGMLPLRIVHNDTKLANLLFDNKTGEALCVVDLDTVMPGTPLHDFGDLVRSSITAPGATPSNIDLGRFRALGEGYLQGLGSELRDAELERLAIAPRVVALELAARFLTDHLEGDRYFQVDYAGHNLERARRLVDLLVALEGDAHAMEGVIAELTDTVP